MGQLKDLVTVHALDPEGMNNFFDHPTGPSDADVLVTPGTVFVHLKPVFDASFVKQLVAVVTLFGFT